MDTNDTSTDQTPAPAPEKKARRWPRRVAIGVAVTGVLVGGTLWYLGRETTLQMIAQKVAASTGGKGFGFDKDGTSYADSTNDDSAPAVDQKDVQKGLVELILSDPELADMLARHLAERDGKQKREPR